MREKIIIYLIYLLIILPSLLLSQILYVSPEGLDSNPGTIDNPLKTFKGAVEQLKIKGGTGTIIFRDGYYYFDETIILNKDVCKSKISFEAYPGEKPVFTSGKKITNWREIDVGDPHYQYLPANTRDKVFVADLPANAGLCDSWLTEIPIGWKWVKSM